VSLFEDDKYQYRETYFLLFNKNDRPDIPVLESTLHSLGSKYETVNLKENENGFESLTVRSPYDFSAMDITYLEGPDVTAQVTELMDELRTTTLAPDDYSKIAKLENADARFEIYHFEQVDVASETDEFIDPGGLLIVIDRIAELCNGVGVDPSSNSLM